MSTEQNYVEGDNYATSSPTPVCTGHQYRTKIFLLVVRIAQRANVPESQVWTNVYARLTSHYGVYLASFPRRHKESLLRVAERHDLLDKVYLSALGEQQLLGL